MKFIRWADGTPPAFRIFEHRVGHKVRTLYVPEPQMKEELQRLNRLLQHVPIHPAAHGFVPGRSVVTAAYHHVGYSHTSSFDLKSWYDTITEEHCRRAGLAEEMIQRVCVEGAPRQGLPTSPTVANIAAKWLDFALQHIADKLGGAYTRYADDLTISHNDAIAPADLTVEVRRLVEHHGFTLNERKTEHQTARGGRRILCGVGVDDVGVYPTRKQKRRLRAAVHQSALSRTAKNHARGLAQWCRTPIPAEKEQPFTDRQP